MWKNIAIASKQGVRARTWPTAEAAGVNVVAKMWFEIDKEVRNINVVFVSCLCGMGWRATCTLLL